MRLRNRSHHQVTEAIAFLLGLGNYRCTVWADAEWAYLDVQPSPVGDNYVAFAKWLKASGILLNRVGGAFPMRRYTSTVKGCEQLANASLMTTVIHLERWGVKEAEVERINLLEAGETFAPTDKAWTVRRVL